MVESQNQLKTIREVAEARQVLWDFAILYQSAFALPFFYGEEMKRFTETLKWDDPWYRKLSCKHKAFWQYICDKCDNAGAWKIDYDLASFQIGEKITEADLEELNNGKERLVIKGDVLFVKDFIPFQIGNLKSDTLTNLQKSCLKLIDEYKKKGLSLTGKVGVANPKRSSIGKGKGKGKDIGKGNIKDIEDIIDDLNLILKTSYKPSTDKTQELIKSRFAEGHTVEDFKIVHRIKHKEWKDDPKMSKYLRPETLYGNKFESYLNQKETKNGKYETKSTKFNGLGTEV